MTDTTYSVQIQGAYWAVRRHGPKGGQSHISTYRDRETAIRIALILGGAAEKEVPR